jgi:hypothetical protein
MCFGATGTATEGYESAQQPRSSYTALAIGQIVGVNLYRSYIYLSAFLS